MSGPPDRGFGGHEFVYEPGTDLFKCEFCTVYEVVARTGDGPIAPCTGLVGYNGDTERVYLLVTENPDMADGWGASVARRIRDTGIGRCPRFSWRDGRMLIESAPTVVDDLAREVDALTVRDNRGRDVPLAGSVERLSGDQGRQVLADNYAAYVEKYGVPD